MEFVISYILFTLFLALVIPSFDFYEYEFSPLYFRKEEKHSGIMVLLLSILTFLFFPYYYILMGIYWLKSMNN